MTRQIRENGRCKGTWGQFAVWFVNCVGVILYTNAHTILQTVSLSHMLLHTCTHTQTGKQQQNLPAELSSVVIPLS